MCFKWNTEVFFGSFFILFCKISLHLRTAATFYSSNVTGLFCGYSLMVATGVLTAPVKILRTLFH